VTLVKSPTKFSERQKRTVRALGLTRLHQTVEQADGPVVRGMVAKVAHLVEVEEVK
jgi:large subunit ribosomal protein L30